MDRENERVVAKLKNKGIELAMKIKRLGQDDPRRIIHSIKVGMALTLVSLFYYWRPLYNGFGSCGIWAVITVVVVFEFTVGATLSKGLNRGLGTMLAGALGVGVHYFANLSGHNGKPFVLGVFVFLVAASATFSRFFPEIKAKYDYGVLIFVLTFCMISISGYRVDAFLTMAHQRVSTILAGGAICIIISMVVCPVWAGETLHNLITTNIDKLANYLEAFGEEYFRYPEEEERVTTTLGKDKSFLQGYKVVLNSKSMEDTMATFARWEPKHGNFSFGHPWKHYLKIGSLARHCAYQIEALNAHLSSQLKSEVSSQIRILMEVPCKTLSSESGKVLKSLAISMKTMTQPSPSSRMHLNAAKSVINELKNSLFISNAYSNLLTIIPDATVASILIEIVKSIEDLCTAMGELSRKANFKIVLAPVLPNQQPQLLHKGTIKPFIEAEVEEPHVVITMGEIDKGSSNNSVDL